MIGKDGSRPESVAVIGSGIGGMHAALLLAASGREVTLIERRPWIGGSLHLLERTFPTDSCGLCFLEATISPGYCPTYECDRDPLIDIVTLAEVQGIQGAPGKYELEMALLPRFVDPVRCDGCGKCEAVCPVSGPGALYEEGLGPRKAIYPPPARSVPAAYVIDPVLCNLCGRCVDACPRGAIDLSAEGARRILGASSLILAPGFTPFPAERKGEYGYGHYANVVTSLQMERLLSISGPTGGKLLRPSDGRPAQRVAFISCVGSRDGKIHREYCSSVCCMISAKQAAVAREFDPEVECTVFFIDLRAGGKDYDRYIQQRKTLTGLRYQRCQVSAIKELKGSGDLQIEYWDHAAGRRVEIFDLAVLAVGFEPSLDARELACRLDIPTDAYGFARGDSPPAAGDVPMGIFPAGAYRRPKDIPETVIEASAMAARAAILTKPVDHTKGALGRSAVRPGFDEEVPRAGLFVCRNDNHGVPSAGVDASGQEQAFQSLLGSFVTDARFAVAHIIPSLTRAAGRDALVELGGEGAVTRLVIATHVSRRDPVLESRLSEALATLGLPEGAVEAAPLPALSSIDDEPERWLADATAAIHQAISGLLARRLFRDALSTTRWEPEAGLPNMRVAVIGGGPAGIAAADTLSRLGPQVFLIESRDVLGGMGREIRKTVAGFEPTHWLAERIEAISRHPTVETCLAAGIDAISRREGSYLVGLADNRTLAVDSLILATGGREARESPASASLGLGRDPRVVTSHDLTLKMHLGEGILPEGGTAIFVGCVGSRDKDRPYCSRHCCGQMLVNAQALKERHPGANVFVLFQEMRTPGTEEIAYLNARRAGVVFLRLPEGTDPVIEEGPEEKLVLSVQDLSASRRLILPADLLVLGVGMAPNIPPAWPDELGLKRDQCGFLLSEHPKMRPLNIAPEGIFACGAALGPCTFEEAVLQGEGAAMHALVYLNRKSRLAPPASSVAQVNPRLCSGCQLCLDTCPFSARSMDAERRVAQVDERLCAGCGMCAMVCPNKATQQRLFETRSLLMTIDAALDPA